jgi:hypothetical protein
MIKRKYGMIIYSGNDVFSPQGRLVGELHEELVAMTRDRDWWRDAALGVLWHNALIEEVYKDDEEPF